MPTARSTAARCRRLTLPAPDAPGSERPPKHKRASKASSSPQDAAFFVQWCDRAIEWAKTEARFLDQSQRREMVALFEQAKAVYVAQVE